MRKQERAGKETKSYRVLPQHAAGLSAAATAPRGRAGRTSSPRCAAAAAPRSPSSTCRRTCRRPSPQALPTTRSCANESSEFESEMVARTRVAEVGHALRRAVVVAQHDLLPEAHTAVVAETCDHAPMDPISEGDDDRPILGRRDGLRKTARSAREWLMCPGRHSRVGCRWIVR